MGCGRKILSLAMCGLLALTLGACGGSSKGGGNSAANQDGSKPVTTSKEDDQNDHELLFGW
jgi:hypothetical protein